MIINNFMWLQTYLNCYLILGPHSSLFTAILVNFAIGTATYSILHLPMNLKVNSQCILTIRHLLIIDLEV